MLICDICGREWNFGETGVVLRNITQEIGYCEDGEDLEFICSECTDYLPNLRKVITREREEKNVCW